ncbi:MAG TPA: protein kinase [Thermoanaerobaculia bacterium]|nr:protein kinase [Thermoanaerobaculia bacterium]
MIGTRLAQFEITARLGAGGMGEVYQAEDSRLGRSVAVKVLPAAFTADAERLARFERESHVLAQLQHPNIAAIYGFEEQDGVRALVMELVEGPTLAERLAEGALPLGEALDVARQIAEALEEAHDKGIVHRDLKPQNVKVTAEGRVKVLDFGLAKALEPPGTPSGQGSPSQLAASPTLTLAATQRGVILGTAAYMAPEQARGLAVDRRADIWAFGVVLYEMLTGGRLFAGDTVTDTLAGVLKGEIDLDALPPGTPSAIRRLLRRCLERQPRERLRDIGDARLVLEDVRAGRADEVLPSPAADGRRPRGLWPLAANLAVGILGTLAVVALVGRGEARPTVPLRAAITLPEPLELAYGDRALALSPDGSRLVLALAGGEQPERLYLRALDEIEPRPLPGTEGATYPFWSPDGTAIGFFAGGKLKRVDLPSGAVRTLCDAPQGRGGTWSPRGTIVFAPSATGVLWQVGAEGGRPSPFTALASETEQHRLPQVLPDGRSVIFFVVNRSVAGERAVYAFDPERGATIKLLDTASEAIYVDPGYIAFLSEGNLMLQPFDSERLALSGAPRPVASGLAPVGRAYLDVAFDAGGRLVYREAWSPPGFRLSWLDAAGEEAPAWPEVLPGFWEDGTVSPDGRRIAIAFGDAMGQGHLRVLDPQRRTQAPLGEGAEHIARPVWAPDGQALAVVAELDGQFQLGWVPARAGETPRPLTSDIGMESYPGSVTPDGRTVLFSRWSNVDKIGDLLLADVDGEAPPRPFLAGPGQESFPLLSMDARWVLYGSDVSGSWEQWVTDFPAASGRWQVTSDFGGSRGWLGEDEIWWQDREGRIVAARIQRRGTELDVTGRRVLLGGRTLGDTERVLDYSPARQRFLLARSAGPLEPPALVVVSDWRGVLGERPRRP